MAVNLDTIASNLTSKANKDLSNVSSSKSILVESYRNGDSFYRVYSDGWCIQGGHSEGIGTNNTYYPITLLKPFVDSNYNIQLTVVNRSNGYANTFYLYHVSVNYKTEVDFMLMTRATVNEGIGPKDWIAFGYIS